jgi:hypothetical protein
MAQTVEQARSYVEQAALPAPRPALLGPNDEPLDFAFKTAKDQAAVVGSDVVAFVRGITEEQRQDIVNASLLAQLVAKKKVAEPEDLDGVQAWYDEYFDVLENIGFVVQDKGFAEYTEGASGFEVHEAIIEVAKIALGSAPTALALVTKTLESLKSMSADSPWITLFHRESRSAKTARFQVTLAEPEANGGLLVQLMAFGLRAEATVTQVLFFRFKKNTATLRHSSSKVTINSTVLAGVRTEIAAKLAKHTASFVAGLDV